MLTQVLQHYGVQVDLNRNNFKCTCPLHEEKTASFTVDVDKGLFYCFGCKAGGDVYGFVKHKENVEFEEARDIIKGITGNNKLGSFGDPNAELYKVNRVIQSLHMLGKNNNSLLAFLKKREISEKSQKMFGIGFCKDTINETYKYLVSQKFNPSLIEMSGNFRRNGYGEACDLFRGRVTFPIQSHKGQYQGFSCRCLGDQIPKYLNSKSSIVFDKKKTFFGLYQALNSIKTLNYAIVMEGQIDVVKMSQHEIPGAICTLGGNLTFEHCQFLKRFCSNIVICYDADKAGVKATKKACGIALSQDLGVRVTQLPEGHDPDSFLTQHGRQGMFDLLNKSVDPIKFITNT